MSDTLELFLLLGALYLVECGHWVRRTTVGVVVRGRRRCVRHPPAMFGHEYSGLLMFRVLPPFGTTWLLHGWPASLGPSAWAAPFPQALDPSRGTFPDTRGWTYPTDQPPPALEGATLRPGGRDSLLTGSAATARWWRGRLIALGAVTEEQRATDIGELLRQATDPEALRSCETRLRQETRGLSLASQGLFLWVFLITPCWIWWFPLVLSWPWLLAGLALFWGASQFLFHRAHRRLFQDHGPARWARLIHATFLPLSAIRHRDHLAEALLIGRDPLVGLAVLAGPAAADTVAAGLRDLAHPLWRPGDSDSQDVETVQWFRKQHARRVREVLLAEGFSAGPDETGATRSPDHDAPCPRCREPWPAKARTCSACAYQPI